MSRSRRTNGGMRVAAVQVRKLSGLFVMFFFFQAEDGIRDRDVTGVQTCALPIYPGTVAPFRAWRGSRDLVAQSPKFHAPALASISRECREKSSTASPAQPDCAAPASSISFVLIPSAARETRARIRILVLPPAHPAVALRTDSPNSL